MNWSGFIVTIILIAGVTMVITRPGGALTIEVISKYLANSIKAVLGG